ncbi:hypothetical protein RN001_004736 [Aquatica leii]|uniref:Endothelin-converting enzyme 1 n=1 Tax=Aquatica leii TaxID=1421715 RepID=A0AAN7SHL5_9COLE|nr:hypothetical protein RN001_004736 [Aquatica leii]
MNNSYNVENEKGDLQTSWWQRRSKMERKLSVFAVLALLLIITLVIVIIIFFTRTPESCLSSSCVHTTNELLAHMDLDVDPCDDFYEFACGSFMDNVQLDDEPHKTIKTFMQNTVEDRIRGIIEEPEESDDPRSIRMSKRLYRSCMNLSAIEEKGLRLIKDSLRQIGGWPLLEGNNWKEKDFDWKTATYKLRELGYGFEFFIVMHVTTDEREPLKKIIQLDKPWFQHIHTPEEEEALYNLFVNVSLAFGADKVRARSELREVIDFRKSLFTKSEEEKDDEEKYDPLTISELQYKFREIPWLEYINRLQFPAPNISYEQIVAVGDSSYFLRLQNALRRTTKRILANYISIKTIIDHSTYLTKDIEDIVVKYLRSIEEESIEALPPRHRFCSTVVSFVFPLPLQAAYVEKYFSITAKDHVININHNIKNQFKDVINNLKWMDEETRVKAIERISSSRNYIAFPNELLHFDKIEQRYIGYQMEEDNFLASMLNAEYYETNNKFKQLHEPVEKDEELNDEYATHTEISYFPRDNTIRIPSGALQDVMFDKDRPQYLNYGALGSSIGHQIFHTVFDSASFKHETKYYDWLSTQTMLNFNEKLSCVAMHYGRFFVPEIREYLNSSNTKNEDLADIAGLKIAYESYNNWLNKNGPEQKLPGLEYSPKQLFWIAFAVTHCGKDTKKSMEHSIAHYYRSIDKFRVLGSLRNLDEFSRDFQCSSDSFMNNNQKCELW